MTEEKEWALATEATRDHFTLTPDKPEAQELQNFHLTCGWLCSQLRTVVGIATEKMLRNPASREKLSEASVVSGDCEMFWK